MKFINIVEKISDYEVTDQDIKNIEKEKNCILPESYKKFLLAYNGGEPYWDCFKIRGRVVNGQSTSSSVRFFFGICPDTNSVMHNYDIFEAIKGRKNRIPEEFLPIGTDSFGNDICIGIKGKYYGKIYFWDHELEAGAIKFVYENFGLEVAMKNTGLTAEEITNYGDEPTYKNIHFIANSFDEFLDNMTRFDIDDNNNGVTYFQDGRIEVTNL